MKQLALLHGLLLTLASPLVAQEAPANAGAEPGRRAWLVVTSMPKDIANPLLIYSDKALHEVQMHMRHVYDPVPVDETGVVRAVKPEVGDDGKVKYAPLAMAQLGAGVREALIVLVPNNTEGELVFRSEVIDLAKFKRGGCLFVNQVKTKIGITIGEDKTVVQPGGMEFINPLEQEENKLLPVRFLYEIPNGVDSEWKLMTASRMAFYDSRREICVFFYNEEIENVDFRGIAFPAPAPRMVQRGR